MNLESVAACTTEVVDFESGNTYVDPVVGGVGSIVALLIGAIIGYVITDKLLFKYFDKYFQKRRKNSSSEGQEEASKRSSKTVSHSSSCLCFGPLFPDFSGATLAFAPSIFFSYGTTFRKHKKKLNK